MSTGLSLGCNLTHFVTSGFGLRGDIRYMPLGTENRAVYGYDVIREGLPGVEPSNLIDIWEFQLSGVWAERNLSWGTAYFLVSAGVFSVLTTGEDQRLYGTVLGPGCGAGFGTTSVRMTVEFTPQILWSGSDGIIIAPLAFGLSF
jgi:hypothetical protein